MYQIWSVKRKLLVKNEVMRSIILGCLILLSMQIKADVSLPAIVGNGMVLQRNEVVKVWGWAQPGEKITVGFLHKNYHAVTGRDGKWMVKLNPMKPGGPYTMEVKGHNKIILSNILIGDVWVCSGQSNMTHYLGRHAERYAKDIAEANLPEIRQFYVPERATVNGPVANTPNLKWIAATPTTVLDFTVIGYFFAKKLYDKYHIPMGIINTCVGGTPIESWMSEDGFKEFPDIYKVIEQNKDTANVNKALRQLSLSRGRGGFPEPRKETDKGLAGEVKWFDSAYQPLNWKRINIPGYWEDQGIRNLDGVVWYRRVIDVPKSMTGIESTVKLGRIVNADELYINGQKVGNTTYEYPQREYKIKAGVLKPGKNLFVVRVTNSGGKGGFVPDKPYFLLAANDTVDLKGDWSYKVGNVTERRIPVRSAEPMLRPVNPQQSPTGLYNGMIAPYTNYGVKGFLWYQGEANADAPQAYAKLLPALINDWRSHWQMGNLTFLIAQLPNYMDVNYSPEESNWAKMREVQLRTAETVPNTGIGVNIDLGDWNDIHPGNKKPVAERLALQAMKIGYGDKDVLTSGPIRKAARLEGNKVIISFDNVGSGLVSGNGEELSHFAIVGENGVYEWANAEIKNNEVVVWNDKIKKPVSVRYAWADNPDFANLYNKEGLPASPFQIDIK
jgi:sialate O-acetylesterase